MEEREKNRMGRGSRQDCDAAATVVSVHSAESSYLVGSSELSMGTSFCLAPHRQP